MATNTIFLTKANAWAFPYVHGNGTVQHVTFGAGLNNIDDDSLFDQIISHPCVERMVDLGDIVLYDGRKEGTESDLGLVLADVKGGKEAEDGVPIADVSLKEDTPKYKKSSNTKGTKAKSTKKAHAYGDNPLPAK